MAVSPFPNIQIHPESGLTFPWSEFHPDGVVGSGDISLGPDGCTIAMAMIINWVDLTTAIQQLLGYSWRDTSSGASRLRRNLPWQNVYSNQLWIKNISSIKGVQLRGKQSSLIVNLGGVGVGSPANLGPGTIFQYAILVLHFWRPPYYIRTDKDILDGSGNPQEWLRYTDKNWEIATNTLSREGSTFVFTNTGLAGLDGNPFPGSIGQQLPRLRVKRRWYEVPEAALFQTLTDATPNGFPANLIYTQTQTTNPITNFIYTAGQPIVNCVNSPIGGGTSDTDPTKRFFGCQAGTLMYIGAEFIPRPLQLPPFLMQIPAFANNEPISQVQFDVVFHFDFFDPPRGSAVTFRGHNLVPYSGNGLWYPCRSQIDANNGTGGPFCTPFNYADMTDLFRVL